MIKLIVLTLTFCTSVIGVYAQKATDFSGKWTLDVTKSKLGDRNTIETQTLTVTQTPNDIKVDTVTKRAAGGPGGGGGGRMGGGADGLASYTLDGKDVKTEIPGPGGGNTIPITTNAKIDGGKLLLARSSTFNTPNGAITATSKETWELSADGKTLTVTTERTSPRGTDTTTKVFAKG